MMDLIALFGSHSGPVRELEAPYDPHALYRVEGRYHGAAVRFCHRGFRLRACALAAFTEEVAEAEHVGYACEFRLLRRGEAVRSVVTGGAL